MNRIGLVLGIFSAVMLMASAASAAPVTCPNPVFTKAPMVNPVSYTVDPATDCVHSGTADTNIGGVNDAFLAGTGINDPAYGDSGPQFGLVWTNIAENDDDGTPTSGGGITFVVNAALNFATWTITDTNYTSYALGVKDGGDPKWAVFLLAGTSGTVSMDPTLGGAFSHFVLYGSGKKTTTGTPSGSPSGSSVPEPASLLLLGGGLAAGAATLRNRARRRA